MPVNKVFIVDDDASVRSGLTRILVALGYSVEAFADGASFLANVDDEAPGCALVDVCLDGMTGLDIVAHLRNRRVDIPVVLMTGHPDIPTCVQAMKEGVVDFLLKPLRKDDLVAAITSAHLVSINRQSVRSHARRAEQLLARLTPREREVLALVLEGRRNKEIAAVLDSQEATVKVHRSRLMRKLGVTSVPQLVRIGGHRDLAGLARGREVPQAAEGEVAAREAMRRGGRAQASRHPAAAAVPGNPWFEASGSWAGFTWRAKEREAS